MKHQSAPKGMFFYKTAFFFFAIYQQNLKLNSRKLQQRKHYREHISQTSILFVYSYQAAYYPWSLAKPTATFTLLVTNYANYEFCLSYNYEKLYTTLHVEHA